MDTTPLDPREQAIVGQLRAHGASFFSAILDATGGGYPGDTIDALWNLVWRGLITNDSWQALRAYAAAPSERERKRTRPSGPPGRAFRSRRLVPPSAGGRWSLIETHLDRATAPSPTEWSTAVAQQLLARYGLITREVASAEAVPGGFAAIYDVLRAMEDAGRIRRGYFVSGVGAAQFALPPALDLLRSFRDRPEQAEAVMLAATDPANPYGTLLKWPELEQIAATTSETTMRGPTRSVGAQVILVDGQLAGYLGRGRQLFVYLPDAEPDRGRVARALSERLALLARVGEGREGGLLIREIDGRPAAEHALAPFLAEAGFAPSAMGFQMRRERRDDARGRYDFSHGANARTGAGRS
jgi:ATP-dependent Lhr-like helicase